MARMLEQLMVRAGDSVLEIGAGTGYNAALLAHLAGPNGTVTSVDLDSDTVMSARHNLKRAGFGRVRVLEGDGWFSGGTVGRFDRIEITVGAWDIAPSWVNRLSAAGILVAPLWLRGGLQLSVAFTHSASGGLSSVTVRPCGFMRLRGPHAGPEGYVAFCGWTASLDCAEDAECVLELAKRPPQVHRVPEAEERGSDWFPRFLLEQPGAMSVVKDIDRSQSVALLQTTRESLAVLDKGSIFVYGNDDALVPLVDAAAGAPALDLAALQVTATLWASSDDVSTKTRWTVVRPHYVLLITERGSVETCLRGPGGFRNT